MNESCSICKADLRYLDKIYRIFMKWYCDKCYKKYIGENKMRALNEIVEENKKADTRQKLDIVDKIIAYESGNLDVEGTLFLFAELIKTGQAWKLQGAYGRTAKALIDTGHIDKLGNIIERDE